MTEEKKPSGKDVSSVRLAAAERVSSIDPRAQAAWRTWLAGLAHDAEAATATALAYDSLPPAGRDAWLDALEVDAPEVGVPIIALYAPLLGVEQDEVRRTRIASNVTGAPKKSSPPHALVATQGEERVCLIVSPLYLDFVELLMCRYHEARGILEARHEWLIHQREVAECARELGVELEETALPVVVEELAHAVVADRRAGREAPAALHRYIDLFGLDLPFVVPAMHVQAREVSERGAGSAPFGGKTGGRGDE